MRFLVVIALSLALAPVANAHWSPGLHNTRHAVNLAFCGRSNSYCEIGQEAWNVARCESNFSVYARNGQYLGLFQFGAWARATFGFGWNPWAQSFAAHAYWRSSGWSPWECKPWF